jgi:hypothetical protein
MTGSSEKINIVFYFTRLFLTCLLTLFSGIMDQVPEKNMV